MKIRESLTKRIVREGTVDTRNYRYHMGDGYIERLPIDALDTTAALTDWELVAEYDAETRLWR